MKLVLIGKGTIFYQLFTLIKQSHNLHISLVIWDKNNNSNHDNYYLKNIKKTHKVLLTKNINRSNYIKVLKSIKFNFILSINNTQIFNQIFIKVFENRVINYHYSLIPSYKGLYSCTKVLIKNEKYTGISWHYVTSQVDNGNIIYKKKMKIHPNDNAASLIIKLNNLCLKTFSLFILNLKKNIIINHSKNVKDFKLYIKKEKYSTLDHSFKANEMLNIFRAYDYHPYKSPLPPVKFKFRRKYILKNIRLIPKKNYKTNFFKVSKNSFLIKSIDKKWLKIETL